MKKVLQSRDCYITASYVCYIIYLSRYVHVSENLLHKMLCSVSETLFQKFWCNIYVCISRDSCVVFRRGVSYQEMRFFELLLTCHQFSGAWWHCN